MKLLHETYTENMKLGQNSRIINQEQRKFQGERKLYVGQKFKEIQESNWKYSILYYVNTSDRQCRLTTVIRGGVTQNCGVCRKWEYVD